MSQPYDNILKENLELMLPALIEHVLKIHAEKIEPVKIDTQLTLERRPDFLLRVTEHGQEFLLHIEFQSTNDPEMLWRMWEYHAFFRRRFKIRVRQYVVYVGTEAVAMQRSFEEDGNRFAYSLLDIRSFDYRDFIGSPNAETIILAVLADFRGKQGPEVIREILTRLKKLAEQGIRINKYVIQLEILSKLRSLQSQTSQLIQHMPITYDITEDIRYQQGLEEGIRGFKDLERKYLSQIEQTKQEVEQAKLQNEFEKLKNAKVMLRSPEFLRGAFDLNFIAITQGLPIERILALKAEIERGE